MPWLIKKLVEAHLLPDGDNSHGLEKGCALIRANFNIDPAECDYETWASLYGQALWLEKWRLRNMGEMISSIFSPPK